MIITDRCKRSYNNLDDILDVSNSTTHRIK